MLQEKKEVQTIPFERIVGLGFLSSAFFNFSKFVGGAGKVSDVLTAASIGGVICDAMGMTYQEYKKEVKDESSWQRFRRMGNPLGKILASGYALGAGILVDKVGKNWALQPGFAAFFIILGDRGLRAVDKVEKALLGSIDAALVSASVCTALDNDEGAGASLFVGGVLVGTIFAKKTYEFIKSPDPDSYRKLSSAV